MKKSILFLVLCTNSIYIQAQFTLLKDLFQGTGSSNPHALCEMQGNLYFLTNNRGGNPAFDGLIWRSDGNRGNTEIIFTFNERNSPFIQRFLVAGKTSLYFNNSDDVHGDELWISDGTKEGTRLLKDFSNDVAHTQFVPLFLEEDTFYFTASLGPGRTQQLFRTDGTEEGTILLSDTSKGLAGRSILEAVHYKNQIIYTIYDRNSPNNSMEIWSCDLSTLSNKLIYKFDLNVLYVYPYNFIVFKDKFYFLCSTSQGVQLWSSDGNSQNIGPVTNGSEIINLINIGKMHIFNEELVFSAYDQDHGNEIWHSDGTYEGTRILADINPGEPGSESQVFTNMQDKLFFIAYHIDFGYEIWYMSKDEMTPHLLKDIAVGNVSSNPNNLVVLDNQMYFVAYSNEYGYEIWRTDGNETSMVQDLNPIQNSSRMMSELFAFKHELYFQSHTAETGFELYKSRFHGASSKNFRFDFFSYPNPVKDQLCLLPQFLEFNLNDLHAEIIDVNGRTVYEADHLNLNNQCMNLVDLIPGLYTLKITTKEGAIFLQKFVKS